MAAKHPTKHASAKHAAPAETSTDHTVAEGTDIPTTAADVAAATDPVDAVAPVPSPTTDAETAFVPSGEAAAASAPAPHHGRYVARQRIELAADAAPERGTHRRTIINPGETFSVPKEMLADLPEDAYTASEG